MKVDEIVSTLTRLGFASSCIKKGNEWVSAPCPFASVTHTKGADRSASFGISIKEDGRSGFNCLACKEHGSIPGLIESLSDLRGVDYSELRSDVEDMEIPSEFPPWENAGARSKPMPDVIDEDLFDDVFPRAYKVKSAKDYFRSRNLLVSTMEQLDLRWDGYRRRILFKVKQDNLLYGMSGRAVSNRAKSKVRVYDHPKSLFLVGEEYVDIDDSDRPLVVIEGLMGLAELDSCNLSDYADVVALQGSDLSVEQRDRLVDIGKPVVLLFDNDKAGREGLNGKKLTGGRTKDGAFSMLSGLIETSVAVWPDGVDDFPQLTNRELKQMVMETWV